ncbi:putative CapK protein [Corynebacterium maris DSM 45190]|uniref:Putative CapK protein n=1 Tax=Corynebacterium maris DSM 45190 TaxID=1224163 RepID=S5SW75_9CORY|nr:putative CapK protein [Corynebacterium maris]AGS35337.1 putative CapK protein [Corynebacterium maris DSM 45190]
MSGYPKTLVRNTVGAGRYRRGRQDKDLFLHPPSPEEIARRQIEGFNRTWAHALMLPFYQKIAAERDLPTAITGLDELDAWPVITKDVLRAHEELLWDGMDRSRAYTTSGSTSTPFSFPADDRDFAPRYSAMWSYRAAAGLAPFDGFAAFHDIHPGSVTSRVGIQANLLKQRLKDTLNNSWMFEPLPTDESELDEQLLRLTRKRPEYLVGRTYSLNRLARRAHETGILRKADYTPRYTILTSERITEEDVRIVAEGFDTQVLSEYGSVELGVIAASLPDQTWPMRVIWHYTILRADPEGNALVTTIAERGFPLINYQLGDTIEPELTGPGGTVLELGPVKGRLVDILTLPDSDDVHHTYEGWSLAEAVLELPDVHAVQLVEHEDSVTILVVAPGIDERRYRRRAAESVQSTYPELKEGSVQLALIDEMIPSTRGKKLLMVPEHNVDLDSLNVASLN